MARRDAGFGLIAALVTLLGAMPAAARLSRLEPLGVTGAHSMPRVGAWR